MQLWNFIYIIAYRMFRLESGCVVKHGCHFEVMSFLFCTFINGGFGECEDDNLAFPEPISVNFMPGIQLLLEG